METTFLEILQKAQKLCSASEKCKTDVEGKLREWKAAPENVHDIIEKLVKDRFIDERRYATAFARDKMRFEKWGQIKIEYALRQKKIAVENIQAAFEEIEQTEYKKIVESELLKKSKTIKNSDLYSFKQKLVRFGQSRGYENELIFKFINTYS